MNSSFPNATVVSGTAGLAPDTLHPSVSLSEPDRAFLAQPPAPMAPAGSTPSGRRVLVVDPAVRDQPLLGLGGIFTGTDLHALRRLSDDRRDAALRALFDPVEGAGWSLMRLPFGSTDWEVTPDDHFTYDDVPDGVRDWDLAHFSVRRDAERGLFPILRRAREISPALRFHAAVWGIPPWMKENRARCFGRFDPACTDVYARYLARAVLAYREEGIELVAVSPQNESLTGNDRPTPATCMPWWTQRDVLVAMRREFDAAGLGDVAIWAYDHNYDMSDFFVRPLLADAAARAAIGGIAFHDYGGDPEPSMGVLHRENPSLPFYATERTILSAADLSRLVRQLRAGARCYNQWTTISDEFGGPHQFLGNSFVYRDPLPEARRNFLYVPLDDASDFRRSPAWGLFGQFTRHLRPGMVRIDCTGGDDGWVRAVAFRDDATGEIAVVTVNATDSAQVFTLRCGGAEAPAEQPARSVASWRFIPGPLCASGACPVADVPVPAARHDPAWDIAVEDVRLNGPARAGADLPLSCVVRNVGDAPVPPEATIRVEFHLDGDLPIARAIRSLPALAPGETADIAANIPLGQPYHFRTAWRAEKGHHQIFARASVGNVRAERNTNNNVFAREFDFAF